MKKDKILVVDDSIDARTGLKQHLDLEGYDVQTASSGEDAVELLKGNTYSVVLTDLKMSNIDGIGVLEEVKKLQPDTEVIIMTAYASVKSAVGAMKIGAYDYISKPLDMDELLALIKKCLEKQRLAAEIIGLKEIINLYEVSKGISSIMNLSELLNLIIKLAADALNAEGGSIMLLDEKTGELTAKATTGRREEIVLGKKLKLGERIAGYVAEKGDEVKIDGPLKDDERFSHLDEYDGITSGITVPLIRKSNLLGVINLHRTKVGRKFTDNDTKLLSIFAAQVAIAIENSYLFNNLMSERDKLKTLFSEMGDGAVILDKDFKVVIINQAAEILLRIKDDSIRGKELNICFKEFEPSMPWDEIKKIKEEVINFDLVRDTEQLTYLSVISTKIRGEKDNLINNIMVIRDISQNKREERVKKNFIRLMSHKLRTPLTSIIGFSSILKQKETIKKLNKSERESLEIIENESLHLSSLVDKILRFTLLEAESLLLNKTTENLSDIIKSAIDSLDNIILKSSVKIEVHNIEKLPAVSIDKEKIQEVVENLIDNAIKFNDEEEKKVTISGGTTKDGFIYIEIADNGLGIPPEEYDTVFEKFQQLEKHFTGQVEGVGLGLALVKKIIDSHGGRVWIKSEIDQGSKFKFVIPC